MALTYTTENINNEVKLTITCAADAIVKVRRKVRFIGTGASGLAQPGDLIAPSFVAGWGESQHNDGSKGYVTGPLIMRSGAGAGGNPPAVTTVTTFKQTFFNYSNEPLGDYDSVWRGHDGSIPLISPMITYAGNNEPPIEVWDIPTPVPMYGSNAFATDTDGSLVVAMQSATGDSQGGSVWDPPTSIVLASPLPGSGLNNFTQAYQYIRKAPEDNPNFQATARGWWYVEKPVAGSIGHTNLRYYHEESYGDGHWWWQMNMFAIRPQTYSVEGSGTTRTVTLSDIEPADIIVITDGVSTLEVPMDVATPVIETPTISVIPTITMPANLWVMNPFSVPSLTITPIMDSAELFNITTCDSLAVTPLVEEALFSDIFADNINDIPIIDQTTLTGLLSCEDITVQLELEDVALLGELIQDDITITPNLITGMVVIMGGGGSIRSPSSLSIKLLRTDGSAITTKHYIQGMWQ